MRCKEDYPIGCAAGDARCIVIQDLLLTTHSASLEYQPLENPLVVCCIVSAAPRKDNDEEKKRWVDALAIDTGGTVPCWMQAPNSWAGGSHPTACKDCTTNQSHAMYWASPDGPSWLLASHLHCGWTYHVWPPSYSTMATRSACPRSYPSSICWAHSHAKRTATCISFLHRWFQKFGWKCWLWHCHAHRVPRRLALWRLSFLQHTHSHIFTLWRTWSDYLGVTLGGSPQSSALAWISEWTTCLLIQFWCHSLWLHGSRHMANCPCPPLEDHHEKPCSNSWDTSRARSYHLEPRQGSFRSPMEWMRWQSGQVCSWEPSASAKQWSLVCMDNRWRQTMCATMGLVQGAHGMWGPARSKTSQWQHDVHYSSTSSCTTTQARWATWPSASNSSHEGAAHFCHCQCDDPWSKFQNYFNYTANASTTTIPWCQMHHRRHSRDETQAPCLHEQWVLPYLWACGWLSGPRWSSAMDFQALTNWRWRQRHWQTARESCRSCPQLFGRQAQSQRMDYCHHHRSGTSLWATQTRSRLFLVQSQLHCAEEDCWSTHFLLWRCECTPGWVSHWLGWQFSTCSRKLCGADFPWVVTATWALSPFHLCGNSSWRRCFHLYISKWAWNPHRLRGHPPASSLQSCPSMDGQWDWFDSLKVRSQSCTLQGRPPSAQYTAPTKTTAAANWCPRPGAQPWWCQQQALPSQGYGHTWMACWSTHKCFHPRQLCHTSSQFSCSTTRSLATQITHHSWNLEAGWPQKVSVQTTS